MMLWPEKKIAKAGLQIQQLLQQADQNPEATSQIDPLLTKHFGSATAPNTSLIPNVPAAERSSIMKILKSEILNQRLGKGGMMGGGNSASNFSDLQSFKTGAAARGNFDKSISSGTQELYRNINKAYGNVIKEAIPEIKKPYEDYGKAAEAIKEHGAGIKNLMQHIMMGGGGLTGMALRQFAFYPVEHAAVNMMQGKSPIENNQPVVPQTNANIGFKGNYQ